MIVAASLCFLLTLLGFLAVYTAETAKGKAMWAIYSIACMFLGTLIVSHVIG